MQKFVLIFTVAVSVLLITADIGVGAAEDDADNEETGLSAVF